ncbi:MAG TPA: cellulase N-terminal Ig-like domain-containing protein, partial [Stellaceae bacterium]|nr:cellulase N-terminal Ig-like domain-containing protein [Stellaceae bacterium]
MAGVTIRSLSAALVLTATAAATAAGGEVRINQVGYRPADSKQATLMTASSLPAGTHFTLRDSRNAPVFEAAIGAKGPGWNDRYPATYTLDFSAFTTAGRYTVAVGAPENAISP